MYLRATKSFARFLLGMGAGMIAGYIFGQVIGLALEVMCLSNKVCY